ncbi:sigma-70 family RNA polymerase sigma factor [Flammeovirgaceae bacterium SG7u.111]|nr:sigma-70 family RNA polymerase sigma factor [Flammeovirgaceae bacterium SG7u.132]WPO35809.1 sigma-70 family RNA polymerase sigma factor [Flammeovirgaceae bacterium SG7u.111]
MNSASSKDQELLLKLQGGDESVLVWLYTKNKKDFLGWAYKYYQLREDEAEDVFQDAIISFNDNVRLGKLTELSSSLKTYIFAIAKNLVLKHLHKSKRIDLHEDGTTYAFDTSDSIEKEIVSSEKVEMIRGILQQIKDPCHSILKMFYYKKYPMEVIARELNYKNENVVKSQKLRCVNELKKLIKQKYTKEDLL